jgi:protein-disulfide isomerase
MRGLSHGLALAALLAVSFSATGASAETPSAKPPAEPTAVATVSVIQPAAQTPPVAIVAGEPIASAALDELIRPQLADLRAQEQQLRLKAIEVLIARALAKKEAAARGVSVEALDKAEVDDKVTVTDAEAKAFYDANKERFGSTPEADALKQTLQGLGQQRRGERRAAFMRELRTKYSVKVLLEPYRAPVMVDEAPIRGNVNAPVTVLEFSDFQCPYCIRARPTVARVREAYGDKVRWAFRHFPLDFHNMAQKAGEAAACAGDQGKFWEMHDRLWQASGKLEVPELKKIAAAIPLDTALFDKCLDSGERAELVSHDLGSGAGWGVSGTPAFFVNGRPLVGAQPFEAFQQVIDDELQRIAAAPPAASAPAAGK